MSYYNDLADDLIEALPLSEESYRVLDHGYVQCIDHLGSDTAIVNAARVSYASQSRGDVEDKKLLMRLYRDQHTSPFEMGKIVFQIKLPIFVMRQFVRHRMQNLNEVSARYKKLPSEFYIPANWRTQDVKNKQHTAETKGELTLPRKYTLEDVDGSLFSSNNPTIVLEHYCKDSYILYENMLEAGIGREMARMVLPLNVYTEILCCWDMKNLLHFLRLRLDVHAQLEIQAYAVAMYKIAKCRFPWVMEAFERYKITMVDQQDKTLQYE